MTRIFALLGLLLLFPQAGLSADWAVDPAKSRLGFSSIQTGQPFEGVFKNWSAKISLDPDDLSAASIRVEIDMASVDTSDMQRDSVLPEVEWFDVAHFPKAVFESKNVRLIEGNKYEAEGTLTIRGIGKKVLLPFTLEIDGAVAQAAGGLTLVRTDFGVGQNMWASGQWIGLEVKVTFEIRASTGE
ncbi:YceI family protein [Emcibacter nanhaiensis]|uniref:YceI family protein n=1 Tax=Emcibacter nanhaiensis TaxID=1505037 RepID=A0A501PGK1_9PROT|nr:YceI family protein [Emcibacter nanhaiensis]TPD59142.1 YceI family protein [Emcibacter nanhaiensis]